MEIGEDLAQFFRFGPHLSPQRHAARSRCPNIYKLRKVRVNADSAEGTFANMRTPCGRVSSGHYYLALMSCPRISPPLLSGVWMLTYHLPARRSVAWASVSVAEPVIGLAVPVIGSATPAFFPTSAGPWKWAMVALPVSPENVTV